MKKRDFLKLVFNTASLFFFSTLPSFSNSHKKKNKRKKKNNKRGKKKKKKGKRKATKGVKKKENIL